MESHQDERALYTYEQDSSKEIYKKALEMALKKNCTYFEFCVRHDIDFKEDYSNSYSDQTYCLIEELSDFLVSEVKTNSWSTGIILSREKMATVYRFSLNPTALTILLKYSNSISNWCGPTLPEDIAFFQEDKLWMATIGHEVETFWFLTESEYQEIKEVLGIDPWKS